MSLDLFGWYLEGLGCGPEDVIKGDAWEAAQQLWPAMSLFNDAAARQAGVDAGAYDRAGEQAADGALRHLVETGEIVLEDERAFGVLRERLLQTIVVLTANAEQGWSVLMPPPHLPADEKMIALLALYLHEMVLPFAPGSVLPPRRERH